MQNILDDAQVYGNARVSGDARVCGNASVCGNAQISGNAWVCCNAQISGDAQVYGNARVSGDARVCGDAQISGDARVCGDAQISGDARVCGNARVCGDACITKSEHCFVGWFEGRTGYYPLTLYLTSRGTIQFNWGCRHGDDLRYYLENEGYSAELRKGPLAFLEMFEKINDIK